MENPTPAAKPARKFKKRYIAYFLGCLLLFGYLSDRKDGKPESSGTATAAAVTEETAAYSVTAPEILQEYHANEVSADQKYKGKTILVTGIVESIKKDFMDNIKVGLRGDGYFKTVHCSLEDEKAAASLVKGQQVTMRGKCDGMVVGSVTMRDCVAY